MDDWGTRDPKWGFRLFRLVIFHLFLIWLVDLGLFMMRARALGLLSSGSRPKGHGIHNKFL